MFCARLRRYNMPKPSWRSLIFSAVILIAALPSAFGANGALHTFYGTSAGASPVAPLTSDRHGNLYGTTEYGGPADLGTVFELSPDGSGGYTFTVIYSFHSRRPWIVSQSQPALDTR